MSASPAPRYVFMNLPHAHMILGRMVHALQWLETPQPGETSVPELLAELDRLLQAYAYDPPQAEAVEVAEAPAAVARRLVDEFVRIGYQGDRLGQCVRNLFECLGLPEEGADLSLLCGERPDSPMRP
ncbi:MAG: hypothetical protein ACRDFW_06965 [bacterium]